MNRLVALHGPRAGGGRRRRRPLLPPFDSPAGDASAAAFSSYYEEQRGEILFWCWLSVVSTSLLLAPFVAFRNALGQHAPELATVGLVASVATVVLTVAGFATLAAVAYDVEKGRRRGR